MSSHEYYQAQIYIYIYIYIYSELENMGQSMIDVKQSRWIQKWANGSPHLMLSGGSPSVNSLDQIAQSGNDRHSSIRVTSIERGKDSHSKIIMTLIKTTRLNCPTVYAGKRRARPIEVWRFWSRSPKNQL